MVTHDDIGKRLIMWDNITNQWEPTNHRLHAVAHADDGLVAVIQTPDEPFSWFPINEVRAIDEEGSGKRSF